MLSPEQIAEMDKISGLQDLQPRVQQANDMSEIDAAIQSSVKPPSKFASFLDNLGEVGGNFGEGVNKGIASTAEGMGKIGQNILGQTVGRGVNMLTGRGNTPIKPQSMFSKEQLQTTNTPQHIGFGTEKTAEYFLPATKAAKAERAVDLLAQGIKSSLGASLARIGGKSAVQGLSAGGVNTLQTGGDMKQAATTAALAGVGRGLIAIGGEVARAFHLPERLYST